MTFKPKKLISGCRIFAAAGFLLTGCSAICPEKPPVQQTVTAKRIQIPVPLDGTLNAAVWRDAPEYKLIPFVTHLAMKPKTAEAISRTKYTTDAWAKLLYDDTNLYIGFRIENDDIHAMKQQDQIPLFQYGDTVEVFLKPVQSNGYFELYANASGNKASYYFPSRSFVGSRIAELTDLFPGFEVKSRVDGTLNDTSDTDRGWTSVMVIRRSLLEEKTGVPFDERTSWTILIAGYAYSKNKIHTSCFAYPLLPELHYHRTEYYAPLILGK